jgi:hypothetical protein
MKSDIPANEVRHPELLLLIGLPSHKPIIHKNAGVAAWEYYLPAAAGSHEPPGSTALGLLAAASWLLIDC